MTGPSAEMLDMKLTERLQPLQAQAVNNGQLSRARKPRPWGHRPENARAET